MLQRVRQFWQALTARLSDADRRHIGQALASGEHRLFNRLPRHEQVHSVKVAYTAANLSRHLSPTEQTLLRQAALLHDIGKVPFGLGPVAKSLAVLGAKLFPNWCRRRSANTHSIFYAYYHHPAVGQAMAQELQLPPRVIAMIAAHHTPPQPGEDPLLTILRRADALN